MASSQTFLNSCRKYQPQQQAQAVMSAKNDQVKLRRLKLEEERQN